MRTFMLIAIAIVLLRASPRAVAQDAPRPGERPRGGPMRWRADMGRDERQREFAGEIAARMFMMGGQFGVGVRSSGPIMYPWTVNIIDRAHFDVADLLAQKGEPDEAIEELRAVIENSPDEDAVASAHLSIGNISRMNKNDLDGALAEYKKATGLVANYAADGIAEIFRGKEQPAEGAAILEGLIPEARGSRTMALLLITVSKLYEQSGDRQKAIATLRRGQELIHEEDGFRAFFMGGDRYKEAMEKAAGLKEEGKDKEAEEALADIQTPWRGRFGDRGMGGDRQRPPPEAGVNR